MSAFAEDAVLFNCEGEELVGVVSRPVEGCASVGVLIIVGGPQYRVGSHRQFVLLARALAGNGIPCMRFDYRGMGDATGQMRTFEAVSADIARAIDVLFQQVPGMEKVVLWGLCDGASAACFAAPVETRVAGLVLLNPWVKTEAGQARTMLRHYYVQRLLSVAFWKKLLTGGVAVGKSLGGFNDMVASAREGGVQDTASLPVRMARSLARARKPAYLILSGRDYVAREFEQALATAQWQCLIDMEHVRRIDAADHTFSSADWRNEVARLTVEMVRSMCGGLTTKRDWSDS